MTEPSILFVKPGAIRPSDKGALRKAGVVVVEVENPDDMKFVRAALELSHTALLAAAAEAIKHSDIATKAFGEAVASAITASHG